MRNEGVCLSWSCFCVRGVLCKISANSGFCWERQQYAVNNNNKNRWVYGAGSRRRRVLKKESWIPKDDRNEKKKDVDLLLVFFCIIYLNFLFYDLYIWRRVVRGRKERRWEKKKKKRCVCLCICICIDMEWVSFFILFFFFFRLGKTFKDLAGGSKTKKKVDFLVIALLLFECECGKY